MHIVFLAFMLLVFPSLAHAQDYSDLSDWEFQVRTQDPKNTSCSAHVDNVTNIFNGIADIGAFIIGDVHCSTDNWNDDHTADVYFCYSTNAYTPYCGNLDLESAQASYDVQGPMAPPDLSDYDQYCEAVKPTFVTLLSDPGSSFSWDYSGCRFTTSDVVPCIQMPSGKYSCNVVSAVAIQEEPPAEEPVEIPDGEDVTAYFTPSGDVEIDCPYSNYSFGGQSYCYSGDDANQGAKYADGSERINFYDGSYTITDSSGVSKGYNPDGTEKDPSTAPTGPGAGPGSDGKSGTEAGLLKQILNAIGAIAGKLIEGLTEDGPNPDAVVSGSSLNQSYDEATQAEEQHTDDVIAKLDELGDGDSSPIAGQVTSHLPSLPASSCSPLTFGSGVMQLEISCDVFNKIRTWMGWLIYFFTAYSIINIFFAPATRSQ